MGQHCPRQEAASPYGDGWKIGMNQARKYPSGESPHERIISAARRLFGTKGFFATTTAELASEASVSIGQIYRLFSGKDDIILAIVEDNVRARVAKMHAIFDAMEAGDLDMFDALKAIIEISLHDPERGLSFEILAEAWRNPPVAERLDSLTDFYRDGVRRLAALARPNVSAAELDAYVNVMMACFIGFGQRTSNSPPVDAEATSHGAACLLIKALGLAQPDASAGSHP